MNLFDGRLIHTTTIRRNRLRVHVEYCEQSGDHDYIIKSETIGDYEVINGTMTYYWYECVYCGHISDKEVDYEDYDNDDF